MMDNKELCKHARVTTFEYRRPQEYTELETICLDCGATVDKKVFTAEEWRERVEREKILDELTRLAQEQGDYK